MTPMDEMKEIEKPENDYVECEEYSKQSNVKDTPQFSYSVVVAIDFGTTFSGYAYSFTHDPENIHIMRKWEGKLFSFKHYIICTIVNRFHDIFSLQEMTQG